MHLYSITLQKIVKNLKNVILKSIAIKTVFIYNFYVNKILGEKTMSEKIKFTKLDERACVPTYGSQFSAGADLYAVCDGNIEIAPGKTVLIHTGIAMEIPEGFGGFIFARSGLASKKGLAPANKVGVVDADYRGEIMVALHNHSSESAVISSGERIAQLVIMPFLKCEFVECEKLSETVRGEGGFGSTGSK